MPRWYEVANEASFKPVEGGYVFQAPNPWIVARPRYYLVNEAQKAEIATRLGRWRLLLLTLIAITFPIVFSIILFVTLSPATFARLFQPVFHQFGVSVFTLLMIFLMALLMAPLVVVPQVYLARALRPLLADAPRTEERIKVHEQLSKISASASGKILVVGMVAGLGLVGSGLLLLLDAFLEGHLARGALYGSLPVVLGGLLTAYFGYIMRLKAKLKRETELRRS
jgi:hypothetical protein